MAKPFVSRAQMDRCKRLVEEGKMPQSVFDESMAITPDADKLPERLHPKKEVPAPVAVETPTPEEVA